MKTTLVIRMVSGAEHRITLPTDQADELAQHLSRQWRAGAGNGHALIRPDGTSVTINPLHVESFHLL